MDISARSALTTPGPAMTKEAYMKIRAQKSADADKPNTHNPVDIAKQKAPGPGRPDGFLVPDGPTQYEGKVGPAPGPGRPDGFLVPDGPSAYNGKVGPAPGPGRPDGFLVPPGFDGAPVNQGTGTAKQATEKWTHLSTEPPVADYTKPGKKAYAAKMAASNGGSGLSAMKPPPFNSATANVFLNIQEG